MAYDQKEHNQAAWLTEPTQNPLEILGAEFPKNVKPDHVIIHVRACAINPVDYKIQDYDIFKSSYPTILGCDVAGTVYDVSETVPESRFKENDRVLAACTGIGSKDPAEGGFQTFVSCHADLVSKIPEKLSFTDAATLPLALATAAQGLYGKGFLQLPYPSLHPAESEKWLLVWGGASSVGSAAVQLASASGINIIATASKKHHDFVGGLGANAVVDYHDPDVEGQILSLVNERSLIGVFDAIGTTQSRTPIYNILGQLGGGGVASVSPTPNDSPNNIRTKGILSLFIVQTDPDAAKAVFQDFLPEALEKGVVKPAPPANVIGKGLDKIQQGIDTVKKGVSGQKVVVEID